MRTQSQIFKIVFDSRVYYNYNSLVIGTFSFFTLSIESIMLSIIRSVQAVHSENFTNLVVKLRGWLWYRSYEIAHNVIWPRIPLKFTLPPPKYPIYQPANVVTFLFPIGSVTKSLCFTVVVVGMIRYEGLDPAILILISIYISIDYRFGIRVVWIYFEITGDDLFEFSRRQNKHGDRLIIFNSLYLCNLWNIYIYARKKINLSHFIIQTI
jgi:hypothetical protein